MEELKNKISIEKETGIEWLCLGEEMSLGKGITLVNPVFQDNSKKPVRFEVYVTPKDNLELSGDSIRLKDSQKGFSFSEMISDLYGNENINYHRLLSHYKKAIKQHKKSA